MDTKQKKPQARVSKRSAAEPRRKPIKSKKTVEKPKPVRTKATKAPIQNMSDVVYTPPKPFNRSRFVLRLATVAAVVLALVFGISIFFKVGTIVVSGHETYSAWTVREASGIQVGDNLLTFGEAKASGRIKTALPYVEYARIRIKLPDTVYIEIKELDVVYSIRDDSDAWWLITAEGRVVEKTNLATAGEYTKVEGVRLQQPAVGQQAVAAEESTQQTDESGQQIPVVLRASDRLAAALSVLQYLESNEILSGITNLNVSDIADLQIWYGQQYQVLLGNTADLNYKIKCMKGVVEQLPEYESGQIDVCFAAGQTQPIFRPFD